MPISPGRWRSQEAAGLRVLRGDADTARVPTTARSAVLSPTTRSSLASVALPAWEAGLRPVLGARHPLGVAPLGTPPLASATTSRK